MKTTKPALPEIKRLILIDDDEMYNKIMLCAAQQCGVHLDVFTSLEDLGSVAMLGRYDAAIVDYNLEQMTGLEIAEYLSALFKEVPMILVSQGETPARPKDWPDSVATFIPKNAGYQHVLLQALKLAHRDATSVQKRKVMKDEPQSNTKLFHQPG